MKLLRIFSISFCLAATGYSQGPGTYALKDARIVRVSGPVLEHGTVVVKNGLIEAVGENITPPADAWVVDCKGLTIYPGMIDALSTWGVPGLATAAASGNTARRGSSPGPSPATTLVATVLTPPSSGPEDRPSNTSYLKAADQIVPTDHSIETARNGGFTTAVTFPAGNIFNGQGSVFDLAGQRPGEMIVAAEVGQFITMKTNGFNSFPGSLMGTIAYVRQMYLDAEHYKAAKAIYDKHPQGLQRPAYDRTIEGLIASPRVLLPAESAVEIERMINLAGELKVKAVLYGGHEAWRETEILKRTGTPVLVSLKFPVRLPDSDPAVIEPLRTLEMRDKAPSTPGALAKAGVKFAFYSDQVATPRELMTAVRKAVDAGLPPADAIRALTLSPAEIYGVSDRLGSIDRGKIANLVVADGEIFGEKTKVKYVFVDGAKFEPVEEPQQRPGAGRPSTAFKTEQER